MARSTDETVETAAADAPPALSSPGGTIGRFTIDGVIGAGGIGIVLAGRDPELDRIVAIKLLRPGGGDGRLRLVREAQAMARVAHPNTVTVYEVGRAGEQLFIAMEYVDGTSLRGWLAERARPWREIVAMFVAAGRGLAAMHAAGLVHRDFKPDNVMVRADGRPQVGDFGLAAEGIAPEADEVAAADAGQSLTVRGAVVGTPGVMSPEQWRGEAVDARADQFAFAVSLWMALFGQRPFAGDDTAELRAAVLADRRRPRPPPGAVPSRVVAALERGLVHDRGARWADLGALLGRLEHALGARRRWVLGAALGVAILGASAAAAAVSARAAHPGDPCPAPAARLAAVWGDGRRRALHDHLVAIDPAHGAARFAAAARAVDPFVASWRATRIETCRDTRVRGRQSAPLLDLRVRCLDARLAELDGGLGLLGGAADRGHVDGALRGLLQVAPIAACRDDEAVTALMTLPSDPAIRAAVVALADRLGAIEVEARAGQRAGLAARADAVVADARRLGHGPTLARALSIAADVRDADSEPLLRELIQVAAAAHDAETEASAWIRLVAVTGRAHADQALGLVPAASASILRAGDPVELRARLWQTEAALDPSQAAAKLAEARRALEQAPDRSPRLELLRAGVLVELGDAGPDRAAAVARYREAIEVMRRQLGPDSTMEAGARAAIGAAEAP